MSNPMRYAIFDIDNCIADDSHRIPYIDMSKSNPIERYHHYHLAAGLDTPENREEYLRHHHVIFLSSMPEMYRPLRTMWLQFHGFKYHLLMLRNDADFRPSVAVKADMLEELARVCNIGPNNIAMAYDDRQDVVDMYRFHGIDAAVLAIHPVSKYSEHINDHRPA